jgi:cobalt/nickel transport system permease protein
MHISEGVLTAPVLGAGAVLTVVSVAVGLKKMDYEKLPEVAILSSVFFVASLIHVPIGPSAAHLVLNGLCGLLLGWLAFPAILVGLTLQAVLFGFGGLTTLGVNTFNMAFPAVALGFLCGRFLRSPQAPVRMAAEFVAGAGAIVCSGLMVAASLVLALGESIDSAAGLILAAHIPVMIIEGFITVFAVEFIRKVRPEMLSHWLGNQAVTRDEHQIPGKAVEG